jgi:hypothetical protein
MTACGLEGSSRGVTISTKFSRFPGSRIVAGSQTAGLSAAFPLLDPAPRGFPKESGTLISKTGESTSHKSFRSTDRQRIEIAFRTQENQFETALETDSSVVPLCLG